MSSESNFKRPEIVVKNKSVKLKREVYWLAKHSGLTMSAFIRQLLHRTVDAAPERHKTAPEDDGC